MIFMISSSVLLLDFLFAACPKASKSIATARTITTRNRFIESLSYVSGCSNQAFFHCRIQNSNGRLTKSGHARSVQYRARKQAADTPVSRLLTRAVLYQRPDVACFDLELGRVSEESQPVFFLPPLHHNSQG